MPRRVALFLPDLAGGGAERMYVSLAGGLADRGHHVDLVLCKATGVYLDEAPGNVKVVDLKARNPMLSLNQLMAYLNETQPDALLAGLNQPNVVACWAKKRGYKGKVLLGIRNTLTEEAKGGSLKLRMMPYFIRRYAKFSDGAVCVSQGVADDYIKLTSESPSRVQVIYNPVISEELVAKSRIRPDHEWFAPGQPPVVLAVGRLWAQKDYPTLLKAFAVARDKKECNLMILGEGPLREELNTLAVGLGITSRFQMPGFQTDPFGYMGFCGAFALSSRYEGLPGALIQALACSAAVVSTDCPSGPREILEGGRWGKLVPVGDVEQLAQGILDCLNGVCARPTLSDLAKFTRDEAVTQYERALLG